MDQHLMNNITRFQRLAGILTLTETMELDAKNKVVEPVVETADETITEGSIAWDVFLNGKKIDTVWDSDKDAADVKRSLVNHDGYDSEIVVKKSRKLKESEGGGCIYVVVKDGKKNILDMSHEKEDIEKKLEARRSKLPENKRHTLKIEKWSDSDDNDLKEASEVSDQYFVIQQKEGAFSWDDIDQYDTKDAATAELAKLKEKNPDAEYRITKHNDAIKEDYESPKNLWVLKVAEDGSEKFQPQFSGTRQECVDEWRDTKKDYPKGSKHKIERHLEETEVKEESAEETAEQVAARIMEFMAMGPVGAIGAVTDNQKLDYLNSPVENQGPAKKATVRLPSAVRKVVNQRIKELTQAVDEFDDKGFNDASVKQQAVDCLKQVLDNLSSNDEEGLKNAQVYFTTLMSPLTDFFPPQLINWLGTAATPWVKESIDLKKNDKSDDPDQLIESDSPTDATHLPEPEVPKADSASTIEDIVSVINTINEQNKRRMELVLQRAATANAGLEPKVGRGGRWHAPKDGYTDPDSGKIYRGGQYLPFPEEWYMDMNTGELRFRGGEYSSKQGWRHSSRIKMTTEAANELVELENKLDNYEGKKLAGYFSISTGKSWAEKGREVCYVYIKAAYKGILDAINAFAEPNEIKKEPKKEYDNPEPTGDLEDGRQWLEGKVLSVKEYDGDYGTVRKMLVLLNDNNKVYGSVPSNVWDIDRGEYVKFSAMVQKKERGFYLYSRPTKAVRIDAPENEQSMSTTNEEYNMNDNIDRILELAGVLNEGGRYYARYKPRASNSKRWRISVYNSRTDEERILRDDYGSNAAQWFDSKEDAEAWISRMDDGELPHLSYTLVPPDEY